MIFHKGLWTELPGTAIVDRWSFGNDLLTPEEMVARLSIGVVMPSDDDIKHVVHRKTLLYPLLYPNRSLDLEFEFNTCNNMSSEALQFAESEISRCRKEMDYEWF